QVAVMVIDIDPGVREQVMSALRDRGKWADLAALVEKDIQRVLQAPDQLRADWQSLGKLSWLGAVHNLPLDRDSVGRKFQAIIDSVLDWLRHLRGTAQEVSSHGQPVPSLPRLLGVIREVETLRAEVFDNWPWAPSREEWEEAVGEFERGGGVDIDDAFAEAAGVSREEWLRLVEERRRAKDGAGQ
ncbi:MAG TPA: hypothetical protein VFW33_09215, partial [Gemmataceae bacterium]|nr:hypothetical protein [Gemmataceae bacterium]